MKEICNEQILNESYKKNTHHQPVNTNHRRFHEQRIHSHCKRIKTKDNININKRLSGKYENITLNTLAGHKQLLPVFTFHKIVHEKYEQEKPISH